MSETHLYCHQDLVLEPLVNQWYAWPMLISPHTAALFTANHHMRMLESYVRHPDHHRKMAATMKGGSFVDLDPVHLPKVEQWLERTKAECAAQIELAGAIEQMGKLCAGHEKGTSLESLYGQVPAPLNGRVELGYDAYNNLTPRYFEGALYRDEAYSTDRQSVILYRLEGDHRPFILSTPRFADERCVELRIPFSSDLLDRLFRMRTQPGDPAIIDELAALAGGGEGMRERIAALFTTQAPQRRVPGCAPGEVKVRYLNHATLLFCTDGVHVLTDPIIPYGGEDTGDRWCHEDLPDFIDYVVLTHNHQDHVVLESLLQLRHRIGTIIVPGSHRGFLQDPSLRLVLNQVGFRNVVEMDAFEDLEGNGVHITGLPFLGEHGDLHVASKLTYLLELEGKRFFVGADANNLQPESFELVRQWFGEVETVFIGMECKGAPMSWLYGPLLQARVARSHDEARRLNGSNAERAGALVRSLGAKQAYVYAMGAEPWLSFISSIEYDEQSVPIVESDLFVEACRQSGIESQRLYGSAELVFR